MRTLTLLLALAVTVQAAPGKPAPAQGDWKPPPSDKGDWKPPPSDKGDWKPPPSDKNDPTPVNQEGSLPPIEPRAAVLDKNGPLPVNQEGSVPPIEPRAVVLDCGSHTLEGGDYVIESPDHPSTYPINFDCDYDLSAASGFLSLSCEAFNLELHSSCAWDWLEVNGRKFCGTSAPSMSIAPSLSISFHSDYSVVRSGYRCAVSVVDTSVLACGAHTLTRGESYAIMSTNYPENYGNDEDCDYQLTAQNAGDTISIACSPFDVELNSQCGWDWLSVNGQKFCGTAGPNDVTSTSSMAVQWHSDYSVVRTGFVCQLEVTETTVATTAAPSGSCCCGMPNRASRIVGGVETEVNEYPWQAGLVTTGRDRTWCGGTIINSRYVMTAAHCTSGDSPSQIQVLLKEHRIGTSDGEIRANVEQIIEHPSYTSASASGYDFALLKLTEPITFPGDNSLAPACLPTAGNDFVGADAIVSGWGTTSSDGSEATSLREVTVPVISNTACSQSYSSINPSMICAGLSEGGKDSCQGDSGGPMVTLESDRYSLIGVVSWGRGCALPGYPGVYARITEVLPWIQANTADGTYCS